MPVCPACLTEYQPGTPSCVDCGSALVDSVPPLPTYDLVEIYGCPDTLEANIICDEVLAPNGVDSRVHDLEPPMFPAPASHGGQRIAVPAPMAPLARELIALARDEGAISRDGIFIGR
jgi:hypothetical protein